MASYEPVTDEMSTITIPVAVVGDYVYPMIPTYMIEGTLPIKKGGTGIKSLVGGNRFICSSIDGTLMEEVDFSLDTINEKENALKNMIHKNRFYEVNIPTTGWVANTISGDGYMLNISVPGLTTKDNPIIGLLSDASSIAVKDAQNQAFNCIDNVLVRNDSIIVICFNKTPSTSITIGINCISPNDD